MNEKNDNNRFKFMSNDELLKMEETTGEILEDETLQKEDGEVEVALDEMQIVKDAKLDELKVIGEPEEEVIEFEFVDDLADLDEPEEENVESVVKEKRKEKRNRKIYVGFEARVIAFILIVLALFFGACYFILEACNYGKDRIVTYDESSDASYSVCVKNSNYYNSTCLAEGLQYIGTIVDDIKVKFNYDVKLSEEIDYNLGYHVVGITKIHDRNDVSKVFYQNEDVLVERTDISDTSNTIKVRQDVLVDWHNYNNYVVGYQKLYGVASAAELELVMYLDEEQENRKVASVTIPLGVNTFGITKNAILKTDQKVELDNDVWNEYNSICAIAASILIILALIILFRVTKLVLRVTTNENKYQAMLEQILREYDELIVTTKDGYVEGNKQVIKVASFKELVDARNALAKPIIYSKINSVKSEFIVEDVDKIYKYVIKEADFM